MSSTNNNDSLQKKPATKVALRASTRNCTLNVGADQFWNLLRKSFVLGINLFQTTFYYNSKCGLMIKIDDRKMKYFKQTDACICPCVLSAYAGMWVNDPVESCVFHQGQNFIIMTPTIPRGSKPVSYVRTKDLKYNYHLPWLDSVDKNKKVKEYHTSDYMPRSRSTFKLTYYRAPDDTSITIKYGTKQMVVPLPPEKIKSLSTILDLKEMPKYMTKEVDPFDKIIDLLPKEMHANKKQIVQLQGKLRSFDASHPGLLVPENLPFIRFYLTYKSDPVDLFKRDQFDVVNGLAVDAKVVGNHGALLMTLNYRHEEVYLAYKSLCRYTKVKGYQPKWLQLEDYLPPKPKSSSLDDVSDFLDPDDIVMVDVDDDTVFSDKLSQQPANKFFKEDSDDEDDGAEISSPPGDTNTLNKPPKTNESSENTKELSDEKDNKSYGSASLVISQKDDDTKSMVAISAASSDSTRPRSKSSSSPVAQEASIRVHQRSLDSPPPSNSDSSRSPSPPLDPLKLPRVTEPDSESSSSGYDLAVDQRNLIRRPDDFVVYACYEGDQFIRADSVKATYRLDVSTMDVLDARKSWEKSVGDDPSYKYDFCYVYNLQRKRYRIFGYEWEDCGSFTLPASQFQAISMLSRGGPLNTQKIARHLQACQLGPNCPDDFGSSRMAAVIGLSIQDGPSAFREVYSPAWKFISMLVSGLCGVLGSYSVSRLLSSTLDKIDPLLNSPHMFLNFLVLVDKWLSRCPWWVQRICGPIIGTGTFCFHTLCKLIDIVIRIGLVPSVAFLVSIVWMYYLGNFLLHFTATRVPENNSPYAFNDNRNVSISAWDYSLDLFMSGLSGSNVDDHPFVLYPNNNPAQSIKFFNQTKMEQVKYSSYYSYYMGVKPFDLYVPNKYDRGQLVNAFNNRFGRAKIDISDENQRRMIDVMRDDILPNLTTYVRPDFYDTHTVIDYVHHQMDKGVIITADLPHVTEIANQLDALLHTGDLSFSDLLTYIRKHDQLKCFIKDEIYLKPTKTLRFIINEHWCRKLIMGYLFWPVEMAVVHSQWGREHMVKNMSIEQRQEVLTRDFDPATHVVEGDGTAFDHSITPWFRRNIELPVMLHVLDHVPAHWRELYSTVFLMLYAKNSYVAYNKYFSIKFEGQRMSGENPTSVFNGVDGATAYVAALRAQGFTVVKYRVEGDDFMAWITKPGEGLVRPTNDFGIIMKFIERDTWKDCSFCGLHLDHHNHLAKEAKELKYKMFSLFTNSPMSRRQKLVRWKSKLLSYQQMYPHLDELWSDPEVIQFTNELSSVSLSEVAKYRSTHPKEIAWMIRELLNQQSLPDTLEIVDDFLEM